MRRRILDAILLSTGIALLGFGFPLAITVQNRYRDDALLQLSADAATAAVAVPGSFARDHDLPELPDPPRNVDVALYDITGRRVLGEGPDQADRIAAATLRTGDAHQDRGALTVAFPISDEETVVGAIRTSIPNDVVAARVHRAWAAMGALAAIVFAAATLLATRRSRTLARPLDELRRDAATIGDGGEIPRRPDRGIAEIDAVHHALVTAATQLNDLLARERALGADLAHQFRTPLASLRLRLETEQADPDHPHQLVGDALTDVDRLEHTINDLLMLARDVSSTREPHALATLVKDASAPWASVLANAGRLLDLRLEPELPWVAARPQAVRQILDVLVANATKHGAGTVTITGSRVRGGAIIAVADEGTAVLDPTVVFDRRNPAAAGTGIGLALARRLADAEGLRLLVAHPGPGAVFHLAFGGPVGR